MLQEIESARDVLTNDQRAIARELTAYVWEYYSNLEEPIVPLSRIARLSQPKDVHEFPVDEHSKTVGLLTAQLLGSDPIEPLRAEEFPFFSQLKESIPFEELRGSQDPEHKLWIEIYDSCRILARAMSLSSDEKDVLVLAGYLHDIGKYLPKKMLEAYDHDLAGIILLQTMSKKRGGSVSDSTVESLEQVYLGYNLLISFFMKKDITASVLDFAFGHHYIQTALIVHVADELGRGWNFEDDTEKAVTLRMQKLSKMKQLVEYNIKSIASKNAEHSPK